MRASQLRVIACGAHFGSARDAVQIHSPADKIPPIALALWSRKVFSQASSQVLRKYLKTRDSESVRSTADWLPGIFLDFGHRRTEASAAAHSHSYAFRQRAFRFLFARHLNQLAAFWTRRRKPDSVASAMQVTGRCAARVSLANLKLGVLWRLGQTRNEVMRILPPISIHHEPS